MYFPWGCEYDTVANTVYAAACVAGVGRGGVGDSGDVVTGPGTPECNKYDTGLKYVAGYFFYLGFIM